MLGGTASNAAAAAGAGNMYNLAPAVFQGMSSIKPRLLAAVVWWLAVVAGGWV
jgi:hypothetical protein